MSVGSENKINTPEKNDAQKKKKRLSVGFALKENEPPLETNDDEAEKQEKVLKNKQSDRRLSLGLHKGDNSTSTNNSKRPTFSSIANQIRGKQLSNEELSELYSSCIKLSTEGKINQKNTWDLNLIDYIPDVLGAQTDTSNEITNFQAASVTLDASVKIYSHRVDSVHKTTFQVLGGLSRSERLPEEDEEDKSDSTDLEEKKEPLEEENMKKKTRKVSTNTVTLESNIENLNLQKFDLAFNVDPLFKKTSASFDEGGAKGLLLNHLSVFDNCELVFDSADVIDKPNQVEKVDSKCDISEIHSKLNKQNFQNLEICPTFSNFKFSQQKNEDEELLSNFQVETFSDDDIPEAEFTMNDDNEEIALQKEANLMEEILSQDPEEGLEPQESSDNEKGNKEIPFILASGSDSLTPFLDERNHRNWAGPTHWKFNSSRKEQAKEKKTKGKKEPFLLNFDSPPDIDYEKAFAPPGRSSTTLTTAVLKKASQTCNTLPEDVHYDPKMLTQLFTKPKWRISLAKRARLNNESNFQNTSTENNEEDNYFDPPDFGEDQIVIPAPTIDSEMNMVEEPTKVEQTKINYVKTAKLVDVKNLKDKIWNEIALKKNEKETNPAGNFSEILDSLPQQFSPETLKDISVPYCFICLLHLANEKGLQLKQEKGKLNELIIQLPQA